MKFPEIYINKKNIEKIKSKLIVIHHCPDYIHKLTNLLIISELYAINPVNIYLFKVNNRNTRKRCQICSKLTIKTPEQHH